MSLGGSRLLDGVSVVVSLILMSLEGWLSVGIVLFFCHSIIWWRVGKRE